MDAPAIDRVQVLATGLEHDRGWAVVDRDGSVVTAKQVAALRDLSAVVPAGESTPRLSSDRHPADLAGAEAEQVLADLVGRPVTLRAAAADAAFNEVAPVHLVSRQAVEHAAAAEGTTLGDPACSIEQPRANIELELDDDLDGDDDHPDDHALETAWVGRELHLGQVVLRISKRPQHCLGVYADVVRPGPLEVGADVRLV